MEGSGQVWLLAPPAQLLQWEKELRKGPVGRGVFGSAVVLGIAQEKGSFPL